MDLAKTPPSGLDGRYEIKAVSPSDQRAYEQLFLESFGNQVPLGIWDFKYGKSLHASLIAFQEAESAGFYGALERGWLCKGHKIRALELCDVMVSPRYRGILSRRGLLAQMAMHIRDQILGVPQGPEFAYGFPNERHLRLGLRLSLYQTVEPLKEVFWGKSEGHKKGLRRMKKITSCNTLRALGDRLWKEMALDFARFHLGERGGQYLISRYLDHPSRDYQIYALISPFGFRPCALIVLETSGSECRLVDLVASQKRIPLALDAARLLAGHLGFDGMVAWATEAMLPSLSLGVDTIRSGGPVFSIMTPKSAQDPGFASSPFWITMGDSDFM